MNFRLDNRLWFFGGEEGGGGGGGGFLVFLVCHFLFPLQPITLL